MTAAYRVHLIGIVLISGLTVLTSFGQLRDRQIPVIVRAWPHKTIYAVGEPILLNVEVKNALKGEIIVEGTVSEPNEWNGETNCITLSDIYRLPRISQIYLGRPTITPPMFISSLGGRRIPKGKSNVKTIDVRKWTVVDGWVPGKYQVTVRVDKITVDKYTWINVTGEPVIFEIR